MKVFESTMSTLHTYCTRRRMLKVASLGLGGLLAGLLAGLLTGCTSTSTNLSLVSHGDNSNWQTSSSYASATAAMPPNSVTTVTRTSGVRNCVGAPCHVHAQAEHTRSPHHL